MRIWGGPTLFTPQDWYWKADDNRTYSSLRNKLVYTYDPGYLAFLAGQGGATPWPRDTSGAQTNAALQAVLLTYGITATIPTA